MNLGARLFHCIIMSKTHVFTYFYTKIKYFVIKIFRIVLLHDIIRLEFL